MRLSHVMLLHSFFLALNGGPSITYEFSGGRFGDNLITYLHAKWLAFQYKIPLLYRPFPYSDQLALSTAENKAPLNSFCSKILFDPQLLKSKKNVNFIVPFFQEFPYDKNFSFKYKVDWDNREFLEIIKKLIRPINQITTISPPSDCVSIAIHIRKNEDKFLLDSIGSMPQKISYSDAFADFNDIIKFPPESWYLEQLKLLLQLFSNNPIYIFIFTDKNPVTLKSLFSESLKDYKNISIDSRDLDLIGKNNLVLEDFFSLQNFDCLIRSQSTFSLVAGILARYAIEISPIDGHWENHENRWKPIIDRIQITAATTFQEKISKVWEKINVLFTARN